MMLSRFVRVGVMLMRRVMGWIKVWVRRRRTMRYSVKVETVSVTLLMFVIVEQVYRRCCRKMIVLVLGGLVEVEDVEGRVFLLWLFPASAVLSEIECLEVESSRDRIKLVLILELPEVHSVRLAWLPPRINFILRVKSSKPLQVRHWVRLSVLRELLLHVLIYNKPFDLIQG